MVKKSLLLLLLLSSIKQPLLFAGEGEQNYSINRTDNVVADIRNNQPPDNSKEYLSKINKIKKLQYASGIFLSGGGLYVLVFCAIALASCQPLRGSSCGSFQEFYGVAMFLVSLCFFYKILTKRVVLIDCSKLKQLLVTYNKHHVSDSLKIDEAD